MKSEIPVRAFVTFEHEEAYNAAKLLRLKAKVENESDKPMLSGMMKADFKPAPEPTNIIWENIHQDKKIKKMKQWAMIGGIIACLYLAFLVLFFMQGEIIPRHYANPDCLPLFNKIYGGKLEVLRE